MFGRAERVQKPSWGRLYVVTALMLAIFGVVEGYVPEGTWRRTLEIGVMLVGFGTMHLWVRSNRRALDLAGQRDPGFRRIVEASAGLEPMGPRWGGGAPLPHEATPKSPTNRNGWPGTVDARARRGQLIGGSDIGADRRGVAPRRKGRGGKRWTSSIWG